MERTSLWIVMSIFLLYLPINERVLAIGIKINDQDRGEERRKGGNKEAHEAPTCQEWERYDGEECACAKGPVDEVCSPGGQVCDDTGAVYSSMCAFTVSLCQGQIPIDTQLASCGFCDTLKLTGTSNGPEHPDNGLGIFEKQQQSAPDGEIRYLMKDSPEPAMYLMQPDGQTWIVGYITGNQTMVAFLSASPAKYPEDSLAGFFVGRRNETDTWWDTDPLLHLECISESKLQRNRRISPLLVVFRVVGITAPLTSISLHIAQTVQGCLYYPSVCTMRENIEINLKPTAIRRQREFNERFGNIDELKTAATRIQDKAHILKAALMTIQELSLENRVSSTAITDLLETIPYTEALFTDYFRVVDFLNDWKEMNVLGIRFMLVGLSIQIPMVISSAIRSISAGGSDIAAGFAVITAIVDIVMSVIQEYNVKKKLIGVQTDLNNAISHIDNAINQAKQFQKEFCSGVLTHIFDFASKASGYTNVFRALHQTLQNGILSSSTDCNSYHVYSKVTTSVLSQLGRSLNDVLFYLQHRIILLKWSIASEKAKLQFFKTLQNEINDEVAPDDILKRVVAQEQCVYLPNEQCTRFSLLTHISKVVPPIDCYYGYDVRGIRANTVTAGTYDKQHICRSPKLQRTHVTISQAVAAEMAPCRILKTVRNDLFSSLDKVVYYIVEHVLSPSTTCYWGYDLTAITSGRISAAALNNARIGDNIFSDLGVYKRRPGRLMDASEQQLFYADMCNLYGVCDSNWATFIMCSVMHSTRASRSIGCASVNGASACIIGDGRQGC